MPSEASDLVDRVRAGIDQTGAPPRLLAAAAVVGVVAVVFAVVVVVLPRMGGTTADVPVVVASGVAASGFGSGSPSVEPTGHGTGPRLVVDVVGEVRRPGVVRLPPGARVLDAIAAAGGLLPGAGGVNLARPLTDGEQLVVSSAQPSAVAGGPVNPAAAAEAGADGRVDLNRATVAELDVLPGIGPVLAARIVAWRETAGRFERVDQLDEVSGIGPAVFADIAPLVVVR